MTVASKTHALRSERGERHLTLCGKPVATKAIAQEGSEPTCGVCVMRLLRGKGTARKSSKVQVPAVPDEIYTDREVAFASHPEVSTNVLKAAVESGYSESYAKKSAYRLRQKLSSLITKYQEQRAAKIGISATRVQHELACAGFANVLDYVNIDQITGAVTPKGLGELTRDQAAAIQEFSCEAIDTDDGVRVVLARVKLVDKRASLVDLGKTLGMFNEKMQMIFRKEADETKQAVSLEDVPTHDLEQIEKILMRAQRLVREEREQPIEAEYRVVERSQK